MNLPPRLLRKEKLLVTPSFLSFTSKLTTVLNFVLSFSPFSLLFNHWYINKEIVVNFVYCGILYKWNYTLFFYDYYSVNITAHQHNVQLCAVIIKMSWLWFCLILTVCFILLCILYITILDSYIFWILIFC